MVLRFLAPSKSQSVNSQAAFGEHVQTIALALMWAGNAILLFWAGEVYQGHQGLDGAVWCMSSQEALPHCGFCYAAALSAAIALYHGARAVLIKHQGQD
jgi:putative hemolysin